MGFESAKVLDDKRWLVGNVVLSCQGFDSFDGCFGEWNFTNGVTCDDMVGDKMKKLMSACGATDGIQMNAAVLVGLDSLLA